VTESSNGREKQQGGEKLKRGKKGNKDLLIMRRQIQPPGGKTGRRVNDKEEAE